MNVEHVMQIAVSVDDDAIKKAAIEAATKELKSDITKCYFTSNSYYSTYKQPTSELNDIVAKLVTEMLVENKELILTEVINKASDKLARSKVVKEAIQKEIGK